MTAPYQVPQLPWLHELSLTAIKAIQQLQYSQRVIETQLQSDDTTVRQQPLQLPSFPYTECDKIYFILDQVLASNSSVQPNVVIHLLLHDLPYLATISIYLSAHQTWPLFACSKQYVSVVYHLYQHLHQLYLSELESSDTTQKQVVRISYRWIVQLWLSLMQTSDIAEVHFEKVQQLGVDKLHALIQSRAVATLTNKLREEPTIVPAAVAPVSEVIARIRQVAETVQQQAESCEHDKENVDRHVATSPLKRRRLTQSSVSDPLHRKNAENYFEHDGTLSISRTLHVAHLLALPAASSSADVVTVAESLVTVACAAAEQGSAIAPLLQNITQTLAVQNQQLWQQLSVTDQLRAFSTFSDVYVTFMLDKLTGLISHYSAIDDTVIAVTFQPLLHLQNQPASKQERAIRAKYTSSLLRLSLDVLSVMLVETSDATLMHVYQWINKQCREQQSSTTQSLSFADSILATAVSRPMCAADTPAFISALAASMTALQQLAGTGQRLHNLRRNIWLPLAAHSQWVAYSAVRITSNAQAQDTERVLSATALLVFIAPEVAAHASSQQADSHADRCLQLMLAVRASLANSPSMTAFIQLVEPHTRLLPVAIIRNMLCYLLPALPVSTTQGAFCQALVDWMVSCTCELDRRGP